MELKNLVCSREYDGTSGMPRRVREGQSRVIESDGDG